MSSVEPVDVSGDLSHSESWLTRSWLHIAVLLSIPALVLLRQSNSIFPIPGSTDSWFYLGFSKNFFEFKRYLFAETYYAGRTAWIIPAWLIHQIFVPRVANYVLHLGVLYLLIFSLYSAVSRLVHRRAAFVAAMACGFYPYLWDAIGSDYVDGVGIAYYMASFALLTRAAFSTQKRVSLILAGVFTAAMIHTNIFWCLPATLLVAHYGGMVVLAPKTRHGVIIQMPLWFGMGFLALTGVLGTVNYWVAGYPWFFMSSIRFLLRNGKAAGEHFGTFDWPLYEWLKYPMVTLAAGFVVMVVRVWRQGVRKNAQGILVVAHFGILFVIFMVLEGRGNPVLTSEYYASYLIPLTFLAVGVISTVPLKSPAEFGCLMITLAAALVSSWWTLGAPPPLNWTIVSTVPVLALIVVAGILRYPPAAAAATVLGLGLLTYSVRLALPRGPYDRRDAYDRTIQARNRIESRRQGRPLRFWYDLNERDGPEFRSLSSMYLFNYTLISENFPALPPDREIEPGILLVLPTQRAEVPARAVEALRKRGVTGTVEDAGPIGTDDRSYHLYFVVPQFDPAATEAAAVVLDAGRDSGRLIPAGGASTGYRLPPGGWSLYDVPGAWMRALADGIQIHTAPISYGRVVQYRILTSEVEGDYHFTMRYTADYGNLSFGAANADGSTWLAITTGLLLGKVSTVGFSVHLRQGERFRLIAANSHADDQASQFLIREAIAVRMKAKETSKLANATP
jgi:hypothetical protein